MQALWTSFGPDAHAALAEVVAQAQRDDPLAPVFVAAPNRYAALTARRLLGARPRGLANVRCEPLPKLAELIATPGLIAAGREPLAGAQWTQAIRQAIPGPQPTPAAIRAYARTFADLRTATPSQLAAISAAEPRAAHSVAVFTRARAGVHARFDREDVLAAAAERIANDAKLRSEIGSVVLWLPVQATPAEMRLLQALSAHDLLSTIFGLTGEAEADEPVIALAAALGLEPAGGIAVASATPSITIRRAPDPEEEVRAALRAVLANLERGAALADHALLMRNLDPYAPIVHEQATAAGIPIAGPDARGLSDTMMGRFLTTVLALDLHSMHRDEYVAWFTSGPLLNPHTNERAHTNRWDLLTRAAGLVADGTTFLPTLDAFIEQRRTTLLSTPLDEDNSGKRRAIERDIDEALALRAFTETFFGDLAADEAQTWAAWTTWARTLVRTYLGTEVRRRSWPDREANAALHIDRILETLAGLGQEPVSRSTFAESLALELEGGGETIGRFGHGVFVGRVVDATGTAFRHVTILGATDGQFPATHRDDPLLPDRARRVGGLPSRSERRASDRAAFLAAIAASGKTVLSFPVADPRRQRVALPSRWLVEWASRHSATPLGAEGLRELTTAPWLEVIASFAAGLQIEPALHGADAELAALARGAAPTGDELPRVLGAASARVADALTPFEGDVGPHDAMLTKSSISPTALERWAACPRAFFFTNVLGLTDHQRPEALDTIRADERGTLIHVVLDRFIRESRPRSGPGDRWDTADRARMDAIFEDECAQRAVDGRIGRPVRWLVEQRRLRRRLHAFLDQDNTLRADAGVVPNATELPFGTDGATQGPVELPGITPLHGVADRVDRSPDSTTAIVYDYKSGTPAAYKSITADDPTARGTRLQLPVYALAARTHTGASTVHAAYWFINEDEMPTQVRLELTPKVMDAFASTVTEISRGIADGLFPGVPGPRTLQGHAHCTICPFDRICPTDRARIWEHVRKDARLAAYSAFRDDEASQ